MFRRLLDRLTGRTSRPVSPAPFPDRHTRWQPYEPPGDGEIGWRCRPEPSKAGGDLAKLGILAEPKSWHDQDRPLT